MDNNDQPNEVDNQPKVSSPSDRLPEATKGKIQELLDNPEIVVLNYEPTMLGSISPKKLRIGYYDTATKRWRILPNNTVLNETNHTISNTSKVFGYMAVVYPR